MFDPKVSSWLPAGTTDHASKICQVFVLADQLVAKGDQAAQFETSLLLHLTPELVDLGERNAGDAMHLGVLGEDPLKHASREYGKFILDEFGEQTRKVAQKAE